MSKMKGVFAIGLVFLVLFLILFAGLKYRTDYAKTEIMTASSYDGQYRLVIYMVGEPDWPFGETHCRFDLFNENKRITKCPFSIRNDGAKAHEENFNIIWSTDSVSISVSGEEQEERVYRLNYDGTILDVRKR